MPSVCSATSGAASSPDCSVDTPLVSVLVTAYNAEPWIADTLASVEAQTYPNIEVIVVDDGSTDGSLDVARSFASVTVLHQPNAGACAARNLAFDTSTGDLIQFLDADDLLAPDKIAVQVARLDSQPDGTIASGPWVRFYGDEPPEERPAPLPDWRGYELASDWLVDTWAHGGMFASFAWLTPRALVERAGPWNEALRRNQDGEFFARVLLEAQRIVFCDDAWGFYRSGIEGSVSTRRDVADSLFQATELCARHLRQLGDTSRTRRAQAALWERLMFEAYPQNVTVAREAEARARALGGAGQQPGGGRFFQMLRDTLGWKPAVRFQTLWYRARYGRH